MSDERTETHPAPPIHYEHWCEHPGCDKWGARGYSPHKSVPQRWWCFEHFPYKGTPPEIGKT